MCLASKMTINAQMTQLHVNNVSTYIKPPLKGQLYAELKKKLGYKPQDAVWISQSNPHWDGWITTVCYGSGKCRCPNKKSEMHFPTGLLSQAREFFESNNLQYEIIDCREKIDDLRPMALSEHYSLRDYQEEAIAAAIKKQRGIIKAATGAGKTVIAGSIIAKVGAFPTCFFVTSKDLLNQAKEELEKLIIDNGSSVKLGVVGAGKCDIRDINIVTVQTAIRSLGAKFDKFDEDDEEDEDSENIIKDDSKRAAIKNLITSSKMIIFDECQHMAASTCQVISDYSKSARYRFGISATPWRDLDDDILIDACFGKLIYEISASTLIDKKVLVPPKIYFVGTKNKFGGTFSDVYRRGIVENTYRNTVIKNLAEQMVADGRQTLILVRHISHGEILQDMIPGSVFLHGSIANKSRQNAINMMKEGKHRCVIASSIFDEGVDVRPLSALILAGSGKSQTRALQRIGRVIRCYEGKKDAIIVDFFDDMKYMRKHSQARRKIYKTEKKFEIFDVDSDTNG
jgi:superfamily II DNA or RNA helicase